MVYMGSAGRNSTSRQLLLDARDEEIEQQQQQRGLAWQIASEHEARPPASGVTGFPLAADGLGEPEPHVDEQLYDDSDDDDSDDGGGGLTDGSGSDGGKNDGEITDASFSIENKDLWRRERVEAAQRQAQPARTSSPAYCVAARANCCARLALAGPAELDGPGRGSSRAAPGLRARARAGRGAAAARRGPPPAVARRAEPAAVRQPRLPRRGRRRDGGGAARSGRGRVLLDEGNYSFSRTPRSHLYRKSIQGRQMMVQIDTMALV